MVEETQVGVHQSDALLITGGNHHLVSSRAGWSSDVLHATLQTETGRDVSEDDWKARQCQTVVSKRYKFSRCLQTIPKQFIKKVHTVGKVRYIYLFGTIDVISEGEEGVGADGHGLQRADPVLLFSL